MINLKNKKILIVDDDKDILNMMQTCLIKNNFTNVLKAENGEKAINICRAEKPHLVVLDIMLPDVDGYDVCKEIRKFSEVPVLFLSGLSDEIDRIQCFAAGGDDYLAKPFSLGEFLYRVKSNLGRLSARKVGEDKDIIEVGDLEIRPREYVVKKRGVEIKLYPIEFKLLLFFVENRNVVLSHEKLVENVLGKDSIEDDKSTLRVHIKYLREKIEDDMSNFKYIKTVKKAGYKFVEDID